MKRILFFITLLAAVLFSANVNAQVVIADFETDEIPFDRSPSNSGSTSGIVVEGYGMTPLSTADLDATEAHTGSQSQKIVLKDDQNTYEAGHPLEGNADKEWWVRYLAKGGVPSLNATITKSGYLELWIKTSTAPAGAKVSFLIDNSGYILTTAQEIINDGAWHSYSWDLSNDDLTGQWPALGNHPSGNIDGDFTIDAIIFEAPTTDASDWTFWLDDVAQVESITTSIGELALNSAKMYPSVVTDEATLQFNLDKAKNIDLEIFDYQGRRVYARNMNVTAGKTNYRIDMSNFASSMYIAKVRGEGVNKSMKIIKK